MVAGMRVIATPLALEKTKQPVREHKRRRWMSDHYHERIQKKWTRRFGTVMKPCMYVMQQPALFGMVSEKVLVCHPALMPQIRAVAAQQHGS